MSFHQNFFDNVYYNINIYLLLNNFNISKYKTAVPIFVFNSVGFTFFIIMFLHFPLPNCRGRGGVSTPTLIITTPLENCYPTHNPQCWTRNTIQRWMENLCQILCVSVHPNYYYTPKLRIWNKVSTPLLIGPCPSPTFTIREGRVYI